MWEKCLILSSFKKNFEGTPPLTGGEKKILEFVVPGLRDKRWKIMYIGRKYFSGYSKNVNVYMLNYGKFVNAEVDFTYLWNTCNVYKSKSYLFMW